MKTSKKKTRWWGPKPERPKSGLSPFPHKDILARLGPVPGYEGTACGGRHAGAEWSDTYSDGHGARLCKYCDQRLRGILPPDQEAEFVAGLRDAMAKGKARQAAARAKAQNTTGTNLRRGRSRTGGKWSLKRANVDRDRRGRFTKKAK